MSVAIPVEELPAELVRYSWCYLVTVGQDGRAHVVAVTPTLRDGVFSAEVGKSTAANARERAHVVLVFPPLDHTGMSLIVDATFDDRSEPADRFTVLPTKATLHRAAPP